MQWFHVKAFSLSSSHNFRHYKSKIHFHEQFDVVFGRRIMKMDGKVHKNRAFNVFPTFFIATLSRFSLQLDTGSVWKMKMSFPEKKLSPPLGHNSDDDSPFRCLSSPRLWIEFSACALNILTFLCVDCTVEKRKRKKLFCLLCLLGKVTENFPLRPLSRRKIVEPLSCVSFF